MGEKRKDETFYGIVIRNWASTSERVLTRRQTTSLTMQSTKISLKAQAGAPQGKTKPYQKINNQATETSYSTISSNLHSALIADTTLAIKWCACSLRRCTPKFQRSASHKQTWLQSTCYKFSVYSWETEFRTWVKIYRQKHFYFLQTVPRS